MKLKKKNNNKVSIDFAKNATKKIHLDFRIVLWEN